MHTQSYDMPDCTPESLKYVPPRGIAHALWLHQIVQPILAADLRTELQSFELQKGLKRPFIHLAGHVIACQPQLATCGWTLTR